VSYSLDNSFLGLIQYRVRGILWIGDDDLFLNRDSQRGGNKEAQEGNDSEQIHGLKFERVERSTARGCDWRLRRTPVL
jgi:hypothetical protein